MLCWKDFKDYNFKIEKKVCQDIFTFDIETTSVLKLDESFLSASIYQNLDKEKQDRCEFFAFPYIWQFGINENIYYGRTFEELKNFLEIIDNKTKRKRKIIFVHNLSFEFQFLISYFNFTDVLARKSRHVMKCNMIDYNFEFRCSYMMSNVALKILANTYKLPVKKLVGDLDYTLIRHSKTYLSENELKYCENDCLVVFYYIKLELERYKKVDKIPITYTGHVRRELMSITMKDFYYRSKVKNTINVDGHIYNLLIQAFQGGFTHANWFYTSKILQNVDSYDFTSSYPFVLISEKYPMSEFKKCKIKKLSDLVSKFAYILVVKFKNIKSKFYNDFISFSKCRNIIKGVYDNGRVVSAESLEMTLTDVDFKLILKSYTGTYEILESYFSIYKYLPKKYMNFILEKYVEKTKLKNVEGMEVNYMLSKNSFNSLYGMTVTNNIKDEAIFENNEWHTRKLENEEIIEKLREEKNKGFLSFSWGVWCTAYARRNLIENIIKLDEYMIYADTDSIKLIQGYDKQIIEDYNLSVINKLKNVSKVLNIPFSKYSPKDIKGNEHTLGLFEKENTSKNFKKFTYKEFITEGAKKYAYRTMENEVKITVAGVPKIGAKALKNDLRNFKDNLIFKSEDTGKNMLMYNDFQEDFEITDYLGEKDFIHQKTSASIIPATYELNKSYEYAEFLDDNSEARAIFKEDY